MIIITHPAPVANEIAIIHSLFSEGLSLLHVRKPEYTEDQMKLFLSQIKPQFRDRLVLHSHHHVADAFKVFRLHFSETDRIKKRAGFFLYKKSIWSTSTHSIEDFNALDDSFAYAFLSPVFSSISKKGYVSKLDFPIAMQKRTNQKTKLIALGGIQPENMEQALSFGFDDVALLGAIWENDNPVNQFRLCQQTVLSYLP